MEPSILNQKEIIQPCEPTPMQIEPASSDLIHRLHDHGLPLLSRLIKQTLREAKLELKEVTSVVERPKIPDGSLLLVPVAYNLMPWGSYAQFENVDKFIQPLQKKPRSRTTSAGEFELLFDIPKEYDIYIANLEKLPSSQEDAEILYNPNMPQLSPSERLQGWTIKRRQRSDGRYDLYFHHSKSVFTFRSTIEVTKFILYNSYPLKGQQKQRSEEEYPSSQESGTKRKASIHRKRISPGFVRRRKSEESWIKEEDVVKFLGDSYNNLQKSSGKKIIAHFSDSDSEATDDDTIEIQSTVENCKRAYNNMSLNPINKEEKQPKKEEEKEISTEANGPVSKDPQDQEEQQNAGVGVESQEQIPERENQQQVPEGEMVGNINPAPVNEVQEWEDDDPTDNGGAFDDIYSQLGDLEYNPRVRQALQVLCTQFKLKDSKDEEAKNEEELWRKLLLSEENINV